MCYREVSQAGRWKARVGRDGVGTWLLEHEDREGVCGVFEVQPQGSKSSPWSGRKVRTVRKLFGRKGHPGDHMGGSITA